MLTDMLNILGYIVKNRYIHYKKMHMHIDAIISRLRLGDKRRRGGFYGGGG